MASLVLVAELLTAVFQGKELSPGQFFPPTRKGEFVGRIGLGFPREARGPELAQILAKSSSGREVENPNPQRLTVY